MAFSSTIKGNNDGNDKKEPVDKTSYSNESGEDAGNMDEKGFDDQPLFPVIVDGYYGYMDRTGKIVIQPQFGEAGDFYEGLAKVNKNMKWGFIDKTGKIVIPLKYYAVDNFSEGLAAVCNEKWQWGFIDKTGKLVWKEKQN